MTSLSKSFYAVIAGAGAGTGRSVALRFAKTYPVVVLARNPISYSDIVSEIQQQGGEALGVSTDTSDPASVKSAFETVRKKFKGRKLAAAICKLTPSSYSGWSRIRGYSADKECGR